MAKKINLELMQKNTLKLAKATMYDKRGYLSFMLRRLGILITKLKENPNPTYEEVAKVLFLAEFFNTEMDNTYNEFFNTNNEFCTLAVEWLAEDKKFKKRWIDLKKDRDQTLNMLLSWEEKADIDDVKSKLADYNNVLIRYFSGK